MIKVSAYTYGPGVALARNTPYKKPKIPVNVVKLDPGTRERKVTPTSDQRDQPAFAKNKAVYGDQATNFLHPFNNSPSGTGYGSPYWKDKTNPYSNF